MSDDSPVQSGEDCLHNLSPCKIVDYPATKLPPSLGSLPGADVPAEHVQVPGQRGHVGGDYSARGQAGTAGRGAGLHPRHHLLSVQ